MASSTTPSTPETAAELVKLRKFPQLERLNAMPSDRAREIYARGLNNPHSFLVMNRRYIGAARKYPAPPISAAGTRVAQDLAANGIAFATIDEFFPAAFFSTLSDRFYAYLDEFQRTASAASAKGKGVFLDTIHKAHTFVTDDAVSSYLADPGIATVAAHYMGMVPRFVGSSFWRTRTATGSDRLYSQLWHRDYNDRMLMKVFLYITDVGETEGYFEYMAGSHESGALGAEFDRIGPDGFRAYPDAAAVERCVASLPSFKLNELQADQYSGTAAPWHRTPAIVKGIAPKGTLIFADTYGLHRGGFVQEGHRDMVMTTYSTNFNVHKPHFAVTRGFADTLSPFMRMSFGIA
jgi:hypothetical protein